MNLPTLNMADWSIIDFELAFDGIRHLSNASLWMQNQPRSYDSKRSNYHPGADFIVQVGEDWCASIIDSLVKRLEVIRFDDAEHDDRRIRLLLIYYADFGPSGESVTNLLAMAAAQSAPLAA
ncbi:hypothetical protein [Devosia sp. A369]